MISSIVFIMKRSILYQIRPIRRAGNANRETWKLADLEYPMPQNFLRYSFIYKAAHLPKDDIIGNLKSSLELTLSQYRSLFGVLRKDTFGEVHIVQEEGNTVPFTVKTTGDEGTAVIDNLAARGFLPSEVCSQAALDDFGDSVSNMITSERPVSAFQVTWIPGGMVLTIGFHHYCMDGAGFTAFLKQWASNAQTFKDKTPQSFTRVNLDRSRLNGQYVPPQHRIDPPAPPGFGAPLSEPHELRSIIVRFSKTSVSQIKAAATLEGETISAYDAISALLWRVHTRARLAIYTPQPNEWSVHATAVNIRSRLIPPLDPGLPANATLSMRTQRVPVTDVIAPDNLPFLASLIRKSHTEPVDEVATQTANAIASLNNKTAVSWDLNKIPRFSVIMSDRRKIGVESADFGFGLPVAVRNVNQPIEPCMMRLLPRLSDTNGRINDFGFEVQIPVEVPCLDAFAHDSELLLNGIVVYQ